MVEMILDQVTGENERDGIGPDWCNLDKNPKSPRIIIFEPMGCTAEGT